MPVYSVVWLSAFFGRFQSFLAHIPSFGRDSHILIAHFCRYTSSSRLTDQRRSVSCNLFLAVYSLNPRNLLIVCLLRSKVDGCNDFKLLIKLLLAARKSKQNWQACIVIQPLNFSVIRRLNGQLMFSFCVLRQSLLTREFRRTDRVCELLQRFLQVSAIQKVSKRLIEAFARLVSAAKSGNQHPVTGFQVYIFSVHTWLHVPAIVCSLWLWMSRILKILLFSSNKIFCVPFHWDSQWNLLNFKIWTCQLSFELFREFFELGLRINRFLSSFNLVYRTFSNKFNKFLNLDSSLKFSRRPTKDEVHRRSRT